MEKIKLFLILYKNLCPHEKINLKSSYNNIFFNIDRKINILKFNTNGKLLSNS